ncbi:MAG: cytochrome c oxidase subunit I [Burkholderiales bacterium]|nr:cytochrome c oxidase subunit I [Burkholderiales bacterium]
MEKTSKQTSGGRWKLFLILAVCAAPMIFSYLAYYVIKPSGRTNYGTILDPRQYPAPVFQAHFLGDDANAKNVELSDLKGKWLMLQIDSGACGQYCQTKLYDIRQLRLAQGKEMDRIERVWFVTDNQPIDTLLLREYDGTRILKINPEILKKWLPVDDGTQISDHIYMIDPLGNLMMRYPKNADPNKIKKDIAKLLRASAIG